jgi:hypothetical protein
MVKEAEDRAGAPKVIPDHRSFGGADDAATFLDAYLPERANWKAAVSRQAMFKVSAFLPRWIVLEASENWRSRSDRLRTEFCWRAADLANELIRQSNENWCEPRFGAGQISHAIADYMLRYDKAVVLACTLNEFLREANAEERYLVGAHEISACVFFFADLHGWLERAVLNKVQTEIGRYAVNDATLKDEARNRLVEQLAADTDQSVSVIRALVGKAPRSEARSDLDKAATKTASYGTLHRIYETIAEIVPDLKSHSERGPVIIRKEEVGSAKSALHDEKILRTQAITTGPFAWPPAQR